MFALRISTSEVTHQIFQQFERLQDDFLMSELLHLQLVEVVHGQAEQGLAGHVVADEEVGVRVDDVI